MRRALLLLPLVLLLAGSNRAATARVAPAFAAGQVWNYHARQQDRGSELRIWRIDPGVHGRRTVHISVIGLVDGKGHALPEIQHLALTEVALSGSVTSRADSDAVFPDPASSYAQWKRTGAGVFNGSVAAMVETVAKSIGRR